MDSSSKEETVFNTGFGLVQFKVMAMGLTNAPATFQRFMELVIRGLHWNKTLVYLDDAIVLGRNFEEHFFNLEVLSRFRDAGLTLKADKCKLLRKRVQYLGHLVSAHGLEPDPRNTSRVADWPTAQNATEIR